MRHIARSCLAVVFVLLAVAAGPAQAQLARTFVSAPTGNDANDCNLSTPCRTFQRAHDNTLPNGEITVLDPGGYGAVTITKAIAISNRGVGEAGVLVSGNGVGITVNAGAGDAVSLDGLTIKGIGFSGGGGIEFTAGKSLEVDNCVIRDLDGPNGVGLRFAPGVPASLAVSKTVVSDNNFGIIAFTTGPAITATLDHVHIRNNRLQGFIVEAFGGTANAMVTDSIADQNGAVGGSGTAGFFAGAFGGTANLVVVRSVASNNSVGLQSAGGAATLRVGQSTITGNGVSWLSAGGGAVLSYGDNRINGNGDAPEPAPPTIGMK